MSLLPQGLQAGLFIKAEAEAVADCLVQWGHEPIVNRFTVARRGFTPLEQACAYVSSRHLPPDRAILIPICGVWTAFVDNHPHEYLPQSEIYVLSKRLKCDSCAFAYHDNPNSPGLGCAQFCYYWFNGHAVVERNVILYKEGSWLFDQAGPVLPFEDTDRYARPDPLDRLDPELLAAYARRIGIPFWEPNAYGRHVIFLSWNTKPLANQAQVESAIQQVIDGLGGASVSQVQQKEREGQARMPKGRG